MKTKILVLAGLLLSFSITFGQTPIDAADQAQLMLLYNQQTATGKARLTNWGTDTYPWYGVTVDNNGRVTSLDLYSSDPNAEALIGTVPDFNLPYLDYLELAANNFSGTIPIFSNLQNITYLDLSGNQLTGAIPAFSLPKLQTLFLMGNRLTGSLPVFNLPELTSLWIDNNKLSGSLAALNSLAQPISLYFFNNNFNFNSFATITAQWILDNLYYFDGIYYTASPQNTTLGILPFGGIVDMDKVGGNVSKETFKWYKVDPNGGTPTLLATIQGNSSFMTSLPSYGLVAGDKIYGVATNTDFTDAVSGVVIQLISNTFTIPGALPVTFGPITATIQNGQLFVNFTSLTESNCDHYDIEVSADGKTFKKLTTLQSKAADGNSAVPLQYEYTTPLSGLVLGMSFLAFIVSLFVSRKKVMTQRNTKRIGIAFCLLALTFCLFAISCNKKETGIEMQKLQKVFIRIAQVDKDGTVHYSKVVEAVKE